MVRVKTSQWEASYSAEANAWTCRDGLIEKHLNATCVPAQADAMDAVDMAQTEFAPLAVTVVDDE